MGQNPHSGHQHRHLLRRGPGCLGQHLRRGRLRRDRNLWIGNGVTATGASSTQNVLLVKYNPSGQAQWARTLTASTVGAWFYAVAVDPAGNIYAAGSTAAHGTCSFGNGVTASPFIPSNNVLIVKYNSSGQALWTQTLGSGTTGGAAYISLALQWTPRATSTLRELPATGGRMISATDRPQRAPSAPMCSW